MRRITVSDYETLAAFRYSLRKFLHFSEAMARSVGLTPQQHQALLAIKGFPAANGRITVGQLAERLQVRPHSAVGLADRLVARGLLKRRPSATDRRQVLLELSPRGEAVLARLFDIHRQELLRMLPELRRVMDRLA